jgi:hypothetical protein
MTKILTGSIIGHKNPTTEAMPIRFGFDKSSVNLSLYRWGRLWINSILKIKSVKQMLTGIPTI